MNFDGYHPVAPYVLLVEMSGLEPESCSPYFYLQRILLVPLTQVQCLMLVCLLGLVRYQIVRLDFLLTS